MHTNISYKITTRERTVTCLSGNRLKAVLLLYQGGENWEKNKKRASRFSSRLNWYTLKTLDHLQQIHTDGMKNLIVLIRRVGVGGFYKTTHRSNAEYANKQYWLQQEMRFLYFLCCMWEGMGTRLKRPRERGRATVSTLIVATERLMNNRE